MRSFICFLALIAFIFNSNATLAAPLIRDAEIELTLRTYGDPVFRAAGLNPSSVRIFIVQEDSLNAYVAGGANMFLHTGLIMAAVTPDVLIGVMAHEAGHISGGHLARGAEQLKNAEIGTILTFVLGAAAAAASGKPEAAAAVITGGQTSVMRNFLSYTRANEQSADQAAIKSLDKVGVSASGMLKMFEILKVNERKKFGSLDPYMITHPLTNDRIEFVRANVKKSNIPEGQYPPSYDILHKRMVAKLYGFIQTPEKTLARYPLSDHSVPARMARAIAYYKMPDLEQALSEMHRLIEDSPKDPFFHELKGQILFENGRTREALTSYQEAVRLLPSSALLLTDLGKVEIAQESDSATNSAIRHLEKSSNMDKNNPSTWRLLATAYGRLDNMPMSNLALAEEALLTGNATTALQMSNQAISTLRENSPAHRRAMDIKNKASEMNRKMKDKNSPF